MIRVDYLYQADPVYGNNYASIFLLVSTKLEKNKAVTLENGTQLDMILNFKQRHDINFFNGDNYIPISLLFRAYGCNDDVRMLNYCNPQQDPNVTLFFIELCQEGVYHKEYMPKRKMTQFEALLQIGLIMSGPQVTKVDNYLDAFKMVRLAIYGLNKYIYTLVPDGTESPYCQTLGEICNKIYIASQDPKYLTDRDALYNKRIVNIGSQIVAELRDKMNGTFKVSLKGTIQNISKYKFEEINANKDVIQALLSNVINQYSKTINRSIKKSFTSTQDTKSKIIKALNEQKTQYLSLTQKREIIIRAAGNAKVGIE